jgi:hypothetical protein
MPGALWTEEKVPLSQLLRPFPQDGDLYLLSFPGNRDHHYALQLKAERPMSNGLYFLLAYNYSRETRGCIIGQGIKATAYARESTRIREG